MKNNSRLPSSFRDPNGFVFRRERKLYRQVNQSYAGEYSQLLESGLYEKLVKAGMLVSHQEVEISPAESRSSYKVIEPEVLPFISYPYEWSFGMLKDAAMATLSIQKRALKAGMVLKDASAYNIQFKNGKPILMDTLSFERYIEGEPWVAYRQFCQHFLAPLALMALVDIRLGQLLRTNIDGVPLDMASRLLPFRTRFNFGLLSHIHLHAQLLHNASRNEGQGKRTGSVTHQAMIGLIQNLETTIKKLVWAPSGTNWADYYDITNYSDSGFENKQSLVDGWVTQVKPKRVWDLGANDGTFSRIAVGHGANTISFDVDTAAVEKNYQKIKKNGEQNLIPLLLDLANPSPSLGWHHQERESLLSRGPADLVLALALIHHLAITNNVPLHQLAAFFADAGKWLIIEFVPKTDSQVQKMLMVRKDIFDEYSVDSFEAAFSERFAIREKSAVRDSERFLYLMECKD